MENENIIKELAEENAKLKDELQVTKEHLKNYTAQVKNVVNVIMIYPITNIAMEASSSVF